MFTNIFSMPEQERATKCGEQERPTKRKQESETAPVYAVDDIIGTLPTLRRAKLEAVAAAAIQSSSAAVRAAALEITENEQDSHFQHCVRCHEDFDPDTSGPYDCVMENHDEQNGMIEVGNSGMEYIYPCCHLDDGDGPCWTGSHLASWENVKVTQIDKGQTYTKFNDGGYWGDQELAPKWNSCTRHISICFECTNEDDFHEPCVDCCTCGNAAET